VAIGHKNQYLICIKATTKIEIYVNDPERMAGCVFYKAGELSFFEKDTAVEPDNPVPISYSQLIQNHRDGELHILGEMPSTFHANLLRAVRDSVTLSGVERKRLLALLAG
jgi:hypothetical protein